MSASPLPWIVLVLGVLPSGCQGDEATPVAPVHQGRSTLSDEATSQAGATLRLSVVERSASTVVVELWYHPDVETVAPRLAEIWIGAAPGLQFESAEPLSAVTGAGKQLIVQERDGAIRSVVFASTNLETIQGGPLARYRFSVLGSEPLWLEVLQRMPAFAPVESNTGLMLPGRLAIGKAVE